MDEDINRILKNIKNNPSEDQDLFFISLKSVGVDFVSYEEKENEFFYEYKPKLFKWEESNAKKYLIETNEKKNDEFVPNCILTNISRMCGLTEEEILSKTPKEMNFFIKTIMRVFPLKDKYNELVSQEERCNNQNAVQEKIREMLIKLSAKQKKVLNFLDKAHGDTSLN